MLKVCLFSLCHTEVWIIKMDGNVNLETGSLRTCT